MMMVNKPDPANEGLRPWKLKYERLISKTRVVSVFEQVTEIPDEGREDTFYTLRAPDWVNIIAITTKGDVVLVEQYRHGLMEVCLEIPAGVIDAKSRTPLDAARMELAEETGYVSENWHSLGSVSTNPALFNNRCHFFLALDCVKSGGQQLDKNERIRVIECDEPSFLEKTLNGEIHHALAVAAIGKYLVFKQRSGLE